MYKLREFVCKECGHKVVVNPKLPEEYTPTVCTPCYENIVLPKLIENEKKIFQKTTALLKTLGL